MAIVTALVFAAACSAPPASTGAGGSISSAPTGGAAAGKAPTQVCDLLAESDLTALTGGSVARTDPFVDETFPQCVWHMKDATKTGTAVNTVLVGFAPVAIFDNNSTTGRVDVAGLGDAAYAYPPGQSALKSSGAELWVKTHGVALRIYSVPVDFEILDDAAKTEAWTSQSLATNEAIAAQVIAKL